MLHKDSILFHDTNVCVSTILFDTKTKLQYSAKIDFLYFI